MDSYKNKDKPKSHLYVHNLYSGNVLVGDKSCAVVRKASNGDLKNTLHYIALPKDGYFYTGEHGWFYKKADDWGTFKNQVIHEMKKSEHFSDSITTKIDYKFDNKNVTFDGLLVQILGKIQANFGKDLPTVERKKIFMDTFYDVLVKTLIVQLGVDSFNISTEYAVDSDAASSAQLFANVKVIESGKLTNEDTNKVVQLMFARAIFHRKEEAKKPQVERLGVIVDHYLKKSKEQKNLNDAIFGDRSITVLA